MGVKSELAQHVICLRRNGYQIEQHDGGGWIELAITLGLQCPSREIARRNVRTFMAKLPDTRERKANGLPVGFYGSWEWRAVRYEILKKYGPTCMLCGATREHGAVIVVDHIHPASKRPDLALDPDNLQVLCDACNMGKSNVHTDDFRPDRNQGVR